MGPHQHPLSSWHDRLEAARSVAEVVDACYDFVAQTPAAQLAELPPALLPPQGLDASSISDYAVELVRRDLALGDDAPPTLKDFALFFGEASAAVARIAMARARRDGWAFVALRK